MFDLTAKEAVIVLAQGVFLTAFLWAFLWAGLAAGVVFGG